MVATEIARQTGCKQISESAVIPLPSPLFRWPKMAARMKAGDWKCVELIERAEVAVLDDIGAEQQWPAITEALYRVLDARLGRWTVITSNLSLGQIAEQLDTRIASRMLRGGSTVIEVNVMDYNVRPNCGREAGLAVC